MRMTSWMRVATAALFAAWAGAAAADVRVMSVSGVVRITDEAGVNYVRALPGQVLSAGAVVVTGDDGKVALEVNPGNVVRLSANGRLKIDGLTPNVSRFSLVLGRLKGIFRNMGSQDRFQLEFANTSAVASVKGTVFEAQRTADGYVLHTLYGLIQLNLNGLLKSVPQGFGVSSNGEGTPKLGQLSDAEITQELYDEGTAKARAGLKQFVEDSREGAQVDQDIVTQARSDDFAAGRTVKDVHGNIARVEQRINRPTAGSIEFINLTKRESYSYANGRFGYNGPTGPRYDYFEEVVNFNMDLPASVDAWPDFFSANKDSIKALTASMTLANGKPSDSGRDVLSRTVDLQDSGSQSNNTFTLDAGGTMHTITIPDNATTVRADGGDSLWATSDILAGMDGGTNNVHLLLEGYGLDQNGNVLSIHNLLTSGQDPFSLLTSVAGEGIVSIYTDNNGSWSGGSSVMNRGNIDLVVIPDIAVAVASRYSSSLSKIGSGGGF